MSELLDLVLQAHGGLDRWNNFNKVSAQFVAGGGLLPMKGLEADPNPLDGTVTIHEESTVIRPFGQPDWRMIFTPNCVSIETTAGVVVQERSNPRAAFAGHTMNTPWDLLHRAYFNGYARWTYLTTPFLMATPGFEVTEIAPWQEGAEQWRGLRARFPDTSSVESLPAQTRARIESLIHVDRELFVVLCAHESYYREELRDVDDSRIISQRLNRGTGVVVESAFWDG